MNQWMQCDFIQTIPTWADAVCNLKPDTHDGRDDSELHRRHDRLQEEREREFRSGRENLRAAIEAAFDPEQPAPAAAELREAAAPVVERLESGALRIDWAALDRDLEIRLFLLQDAFEAEQRALDEDDDETVALLWS